MGTRAPQRGRAAGGAPGVGSGASLASLVTLLMLTFGVPVALFVLGRDLIPSMVVKPAVAWAALRAPDDGHIFLQGIYLAGWVGWFFFFVSVFLEIVGQVQHRAAVRLPGLGWLQRGVGTLVTAAVVIIGSPVAAMAAGPPDLHSGAGPVVTAPAAVRGDVGARAEQAMGPRVGPPYTVRAGDSLWRIAQEQLGDPNRFADIAQLNDGRRMPDGTVFHYSEFLHAGWVLVMPPDAPVAGTQTADAATGGGPQVTSQQISEPSAGMQTVETQAEQAALAAQRQSSQSVPLPSSAPRTYTVRPGDSLSSIALAQLGDAGRWNEL